MTTQDSGRVAPEEHAESVGRVLHVVTGYAGFHLVSPATLAAAAAAQEAADGSPYYETFGDLRRSGDLAQLSERLDTWDLSVEDYVGAIENAVNRVSAGPDVAARLAALHDVEFEGDDDKNAPSDSTDFRSEDELDNEVEDPYTHTIETRMCDDVPADILEAFDAIQSLMFVDYKSASVQVDRLDEMIAALEARGFTVLRE